MFYEMSHSYLPDHHFEPILGNARPTIQIVLFMVLAMNIILNVGRRGCQFLLLMAHTLIYNVMSL